MPRFAIPIASILSVVLVGSSTAYAAIGSLPGDILYPFKIQVIENMEISLAMGKLAQATIHAELAARRVAEARELASQGRLDSSTSATIQANFDQHINEARSEAVVHNSGTSTEDRDEASVSVSLVADASDLEKIGLQSDNLDTRNNAHSFADHILSRTHAAAITAGTTSTQIRSENNKAHNINDEESQKIHIATINILTSSSTQKNKDDIDTEMRASTTAIEQLNHQTKKTIIPVEHTPREHSTSSDDTSIEIDSSHHSENPSKDVIPKPLKI